MGAGFADDKEEKTTREGVASRARAGWEGCQRQARGSASVEFTPNDASTRRASRRATRRVGKGAARALEATPPFPAARGCSRFLVRDRRRREKLRRPFDRREGLGAGDARRGRDAPFVAHAPGTHGSREPVSGAAACRRAHATANGHRRFALSINTHSREGLGEFSAPEKRVRARCRDDWRSPGVTTARSMRRRSRGRVGRYAPGATRPSARVRVTHPTPPHGCSSSFRGLSCIFLLQ